MTKFSRRKVPGWQIFWKYKAPMSAWKWPRPDSLQLSPELKGDRITNKLEISSLSLEQYIIDTLWIHYWYIIPLDKRPLDAKTGPQGPRDRFLQGPFYTRMNNFRYNKFCFLLLVSIIGIYYYLFYYICYWFLIHIFQIWIH